MNKKGKLDKNLKINNQKNDPIWKEWINDEFTLKVANEEKFQTHKLIQDRVEQLFKNFERKDELDGFHRHVLKSGTLADRLGMWNVLFQDKPLSRLRFLQKILRWAKRKNHRERELAIRNLISLFTSSIMPNRVLITFLDRETHNILTDNKIALWYFESELKKVYNDLLSILEQGLKDHMDWFRRKSIDWVTSLLERNAENEKLLLMLLIFKLGDKENKVASAALRSIQLILKSHPKMKIVIAKEILYFLNRTVSNRAKVYSLVLLSEFEYYFTEEDEKASRFCLSIFLNCFRFNLRKKKTLNNKILKILFTAIRRSFPYSKMKPEVFKDIINSFYQISHTLSLSTRIHSLLVICQIENSKKKVSNRFYKSLYQLLISSELLNYTRPYQFLHLLYITIKNDKNRERITTFVKRLMQITINLNTPFSCGILMLISKVFKNHKEFSQPSSLIDLKVYQEKNSKENVNTRNYILEEKKFLYYKMLISGLWEESLLSIHFHPSLKIWIKKTFNGELIRYKGDPLDDFTTKSFLERYSYKKPKQHNEMKNSKFSRVLKKKRLKTVQELYNKTEIQNIIPAVDIFFQKYFKIRSKIDPQYHFLKQKVKDIENEEEKKDQRITIL